MSVVEATVHNRRIEIAAPDELRDGTKVLVDVTAVPANIGLDESEWRYDPQALADWDAWLKTIESIEWGTSNQFDQEFRRFNIEAVRKQMQEETDA